jgi:hypothetical protein
MGIIDNLKSIGKVLQDLNKVDEYKQILETREQLLLMQEEIQKLKEHIKILEEKIKLKGEVSYNNNSCWRKLSDGTTDGPYCSGCWDDKRKLIHLNKMLGTAHWLCPVCGKAARARNE